MNRRHELDVLLNLLVDAQLGDQDAARLNGLLARDAALRRRYREFMTLHAGLTWDYVAAARGERAVVVRPARAWWLPLGAGLAAMLLLGIGLGWWLPEQPGAPLLTTVAVRDGSLAWSDGQRARQALGSGDEVRSGQLVLEGDSAIATLRFGDGTTITLTGDTEVTVREDRQKRLHLGRGLLAADVRPQPAGRPLVIRTPTAELHVLGTVFTVVANGGETALDVESGRVRLQRLADGQAVEVAGQQTAVATLDARGALQSSARVQPGLDFVRTYAHQPPGHCKGRWLPPTGDQPGMVQAVPYVAGRSPQGVPIIHHGLTVRAHDSLSRPVVRLESGSRLHLRYRFAQGAEQAPFKVLVVTATSGGGFGGNFEVASEKGTITHGPDGWRTITWPVSAFEPLIAIHPQPLGREVTLILPFTFAADYGFTIAEVGVTASVP